LIKPADLVVADFPLRCFINTEYFSTIIRCVTVLCGIFGCIIKDGQAVKLITDGLKRLEYRGYDSIGVATIVDGGLHVRKDMGKLEEVVEGLQINEMEGTIGMGHTRWATHGAPSMVNAHPHTDGSGNIALIHNGVIENYMELKDELIEKGHIFVSRTDTEVIPHLIEEELKSDIGMKGAILRVLRRLKGSYAVVVLSTHEPDRIYCARHESPLVIGVSDNGAFCASDVPAMLPYTNQVSYLRNGEMAVLTLDSYEVVKVIDGSLVERNLEEITWSLEMAEKQGYTHFMLKEIYEQPESLRNGLRLQEQYLNLLTQFLDRGKDVFLTAAGTSYHSCLLGITNTVGSTLTRVSRAYLIQQSGPEIGVAATKTFTSQVIVLSQMALRLAKQKGKLSQDELDELEEKLTLIPSWVEDAIQSNSGYIEALAEKYRDDKLFLFLGRGISAATALEGRLKLLEITYVPSLAYPAGESKHGPISVIEDGVACIFVCPRGDTHPNIIGSIMEMKARGARIISICEEGDEEVKRLSDDFIEMPRGIPEELSPIPYVVPLQLLAYNLAVLKELDPDMPRNLAKSVTVP